MVLFCAGTLVPVAAAHDIPRDATIHVLAKPSGSSLQAAVRVPLGAIRDTEFPEIAGGYLDIERLGPRLPDAASFWVGRALRFYENGRRLPDPRGVTTRVSLPSERSFTTFEDAVKLIEGPGHANTENIVWTQACLDVVLEYPIGSEGSAFAVEPVFSGLAAQVVTAVRFEVPGGAVRAFEFTSDPGVVPIEPGWFDSAARFAALGFRHILDGSDHLLFLFCLAIPLRRPRALIAVITAFTVAHSFTLIGSAAGLGPDGLWFPPFIETAIAASIVWMAFENIAGSASVRRRWIAAFGFGLVHGFGFSFGLKENFQFAGTHLATSLLAFNLGVEAGQLAVMALLISALWLVFRFVVAERVGGIILSAVAAHTGIHWTVERATQLRQYRFTWPGFDALTMARALEGLMWILIAAVVLAAIRIWRQRRTRGSARAGSATPAY